jgi:hypothetical protein
MNNRHYFIYLLLAGILFAAGCGSVPRRQSYTLRVHVPGEIYRNVLIKRLNKDGNLITLDTLEVKEWVASYPFMTENPQLYFASNGSKNLPVILEKSDVNVYVSGKNFVLDSLTGGRENALTELYRHRMDSLKKLQKEVFAKMYKAGSAKARKDYQLKMPVNLLRKRILTLR